MRKVNYIVWLLLLLFLFITSIYLIISQDIILYLAPRMIPMLCFGSAVLLILFINQLIGIKNIGKKNNSTFYIKYLLFVIPVVLFITSKPDVNVVNGMSNQNVSIPYLTGTVENSNIGSANKVYGMRKAPGEEEADTSVNPEATKDEDAYETNTESQEKTSYILNADKNSKEFNDQFKELFASDVMQMTDEEVSLYGFVFKYDILDENTIVVARKVVSCCMADAYVVGYPVKVENADDFEEDEWIEVKGTMSKVELSSENGSYSYPVIVGGEINKLDIPPLDELYVYP